MTAPEDVESFRSRARPWLADNMPLLDDDSRGRTRSDDKSREIDRGLQRRLWDGGFAGICFPAEYGGLGLGAEYQHAFTEESLPYQMPLSVNLPTLGILGATLVDFGSDAQKRRHLPAMLRGEELWVQFLSEPTGGSDLAGCISRAERDGDVWILNGSKIWSSAAMVSDYALCLARTNWDVPKHRGLTMFIVEIHQPGIRIDEIRQLDGSTEFCQEFFDDVALPADSVVGELDQGWAVAARLLGHERTAVGGGSQFMSGRRVADTEGADSSLVGLAKETGRRGDRDVRQLVAEARVLELVNEQLVQRIASGIACGKMPPTASAMMKLFRATRVIRRAEISLEIGGSDAVVWSSGSDAYGPRLGQGFLWRQASSLGGGSNEIQRNIISERVLGLPREWAADKDVPYRAVRTSALPSRPSREGRHA